MTVEMLEEQAESTRRTIRSLEKSLLVPTGDEDFDLSQETRLQAAKNRLERIETKLEKAREAEKRRQAREQQDGQLAELERLEAEHAASLALSAQAVNAAAAAAEPHLEVVVAEFEKRKRLAEEHRYIYKRAYGSWPEQDGKSLHAIPTPSKRSLQEAPSDLFDVLAFAFSVALNERLGGHLSLRMVNALIAGGTIRAETPPLAPASQPDSSTEGLTPGQRLARERSPVR